MKTCPTCNSQVAVVIVNVQNGQHFCHHCASRECPTFLPHFVLTNDDVVFMRACGIDPEISRIEAASKEQSRNSSNQKEKCREDLGENCVACAVAVILPDPDMLQQAAFAKAGSIALAGSSLLLFTSWAPGIMFSRISVEK